MIGIVVATHGAVAEALLAAAADLRGEAPAATALRLDGDDGVQGSWERLGRAVEGADEGHGVLVLADMFGSTASTAALALRAERPIEVVTGANLPMVLRALQMRGDLDLAGLAGEVLAYGRRNVTSAGELLASVQRRAAPDQQQGEGP